MKQPDFSELFSNHFGGKPKKVRYELRDGPCILHDLAFLTSLVHDARFRRKDIIAKGERLTIPINRDCWELPMTEDKELYIADSRLTFATVRDVKWIFIDIDESNENHELWIEYLYFDEHFRSHHKDRFGFVVSGYMWQLRFTLAQTDYAVRLQDTEVPYLYSEKQRPNKPLKRDAAKTRRAP